jgi:hypothetical protein
LRTFGGVPVTERSACVTLLVPTPARTSLTGRFWNPRGRASRERRRARGGALVTPRFRGVNCRCTKVRLGSDLVAPRQHARAPARAPAAPWTRRGHQLVNEFFRAGRSTCRRREMVETGERRRRPPGCRSELRHHGRRGVRGKPSWPAGGIVARTGYGAVRTSGWSGVRVRRGQYSVQCCSVPRSTRLVHGQLRSMLTMFLISHLFIRQNDSARH